MLVFPADLQEVEEVGTGGVDGDEIFGWMGLKIWQCSDLEVLRTRDILGDLNCPHRWEEEVRIERRGK